MQPRIVGPDLNSETVYTIGLTFGSMAQKLGETKIWIGRDGRLSGPELLAALSQGLRDSGMDVINLGQVTSPMLYFACYTQEPHNGIMLTGSHNPTQYNGLKIVLKKKTLSENGIQQIKECLYKEEWSKGEGQESHHDIEAAYVNKIKNDIKLHRPLKIVLDAGNGAGGPVAIKVFEAIG